jgi:Glyoxalase/Bleomycin resistance protein/Dioxygenase superfamily
MEEGLGLGQSPFVWWRLCGRLRDLSMRERSGWSWQECGQDDVRPEGDEAADKGVWMSIWVDDVDAIHKRCVQQGLEITWPPTDMAWNVREMHVRHPDGHVFRVTQGIEDEP